MDISEMGGRVILDKNYSLRLINHFENIISYVRIISHVYSFTLNIATK